MPSGADSRLLPQLGLEVPAGEYLRGGHAACSGCGAIHPIRYALKVLGEKTVVVNSPGCASLFLANLRITLLHSSLASAAAVAAGVKQGLEVLGDVGTQVVAYAGDGATFDIGLQALSAAVERGENIIYICYDNEAYMNTGIQRSSATPQGAWTETSPVKGEPKKEIMAILAAHHIPYAATASIAYPGDFLEKLRKAKGVRGTRFFHVLAPCPTGWRFPPELTVEVARLAVQSRVTPLFEIEHGKYVRLQKSPVHVPIKGYIRLQGRFAHLQDENIFTIQTSVDKAWESLLERAAAVELLPY